MDSGEKTHGGSERVKIFFTQISERKLAEKKRRKALIAKTRWNMGNKRVSKKKKS